jgi:hypothetical protein
MKRIGATLACLLLLALPLRAGWRKQPARAPSARFGARILLIPLDDRPPCLQFPVMMGLIGNAEVVTPPRALLGRFLEPGQPQQIEAWLRGQELHRFDAAIISVDMLAYGGLVNSRIHRTPLSVALKRLDVARWLRRRAPHLPIYGSSVIMRLAPTADGRNEAYRERLARWAEISPAAAQTATQREEVAQLEREIPQEALADYKRARARNLAVNRAALALVRQRVFDYLILSQDDAKPRGVHIRDRERLVEEVTRLGLADRVAIQPGADEVSMLLLARALNHRFGYSPRVAALYSSEKARQSVAPYEDRPLHCTVSYHIAATGSREVSDADAADVLFYVYGSRAEPGAARSFAERIAADVRRGRRVIVADIDFKGDVQGADPVFTDALRARHVFPHLAGYASWNTAGNTIGTALPQGLICARALQTIAHRTDQLTQRIIGAQMKFLLHRLLDDYAYHTLVRPDTNRFARERQLDPNGLSGKGQALIEQFIREQMRPHVDLLWRDFAGAPYVIGPRGEKLLWGSVTGIDNFYIRLPWGRTFEAELDFDLHTSSGPETDR